MGKKGAPPPIVRQKAYEQSSVFKPEAALYAFVQARSRPVICFAHVTNRAGNVEEDFEKSEEYGSRDTLHFVEVTAKTWLSANARKT